MHARLTLILILLPLFAAPVHAGIIFGKKAPAKPDPAQRVPELIKTIHTDGDETKRAGAIEEMRQYDPTLFPEMMPTLIDALLNDKKAAVRAEAAQTIAKIRPVSQAAGDALEQALSALLQYHWAGYRQGKKDEPLPPITTKEPPLAEPKPVNAPPAKPTEPPSTLTPRPLPPMAPAVNTTPRPLPQGPVIEVLPPISTKPVRGETGPDLGAPPQ
jgi:hypothetical protein